MVFLLNLIALLYLYFQRYFHNGLTANAFPPKNFADFIYAAEISVFVVAYLITKRKRKISLVLLSAANLGLIIIAEILRKQNFFEGSFFLGYPLIKTVSAFVYALVFLVSLFITIYYALTSFNKKTSPFGASVSLETLILLTLFASGIYLNLTYAGNLDKQSNGGKYDYAVVLGAAVKKDKPGRILRKRIEKALELYKRNIVGKIFLTGAAAPGETSEAQAAYDYLINRGVPQKDLELEEKTTTTFEQIKFLAKLSQKKPTTFVAVSDQFHLRRIKTMADFLNVKIKTVASGTAIRTEKNVYLRIRDTLALLLFLFFAI